MKRWMTLLWSCLGFISCLQGPTPCLAYEIGHVSQNFYDAARGRNIGVEIYYPALASGDNVPLAPGSFPVLVLGHGYTIGWTDYEYLWTALVPQGYVMSLAKTESGLLPSHLEFGKDLAYMTEYFQELNEVATSPFYQHIAPTSAIMGHSMGGGASFLAIQYSASVTAFVTFAAAETNPSAIAAASSITIPALLFSGTEDCVTPPETHQIPMYNALASTCKTRITITGGSHCQFAQNNLTCTIGEFFAGCSPDIALELQESITTQFVSLWLAYTLKGDSAAWQQFQLALAAGVGNGEISYEQYCPMPTATPRPTITPTPPITFTPQATNTPTAEPVPSSTPAGTATPESTPTPQSPCLEPQVKLIMPSTFYQPTDLCFLNAELCNPDPEPYADVPLFVVLDVYGSYYFWPDWTQLLDYEVIVLTPGIQVRHLINPFAWPSGAGSASGITFIGAMTDPGITQLWGGYSQLTFGWSD